MFPVSPGTYTAVNGTLFGPSGPLYTDVHQGYLGDCWLLSSLAEAAARSPQLIRNMFTYLGNASKIEGRLDVQVYDVHFLGLRGQATVTVDTQFPIYNGTEYNAQIVGGVLWVALAEKAYVEAASAGYVVNSYTETATPCASNYQDINGGYPGSALQAITGCTAFAAITTSGAGNAISEFTAGNLVVLASNGTTANGSGIVGGHAYAVIAANSSADQLTLFNPWNDGYTVNDNGVIVYGSTFVTTGANVYDNFSYSAFAVA